MRFDTTVVRGLEYYTGPVYEVELLLETKDEKGRPVRSVRSAAVGATTGWCRAPAASRCRRPALHRRLPFAGGSDADRQARHQARARPCPGDDVRDGSIADYQKLVAALRNATSAPSFIWAASITTSASSFATPTGAAAHARSSRAPTRRQTAACWCGI